MDIFCLPSRREAFGLVLAEAMMAKLAVVATEVGGIPYVVDNNETGFLVEPMNIDALTLKLKCLIDNKELRMQFGQNGYKKAVSEFSEIRYCQDVEQLYINLSNQRRNNG